MKMLGVSLFCAIALLFFVPVSYAASDCEHTCCRAYSGSWDDDFDDCRSPKDGFDACVSECEARVWNSQPQGPGEIPPENVHHYSCGGTEFILAFAVAGALFLKK